VSGDFRMGAWLVRPSLNTISRNGTDIQVEPKMMEVLVCLASRPGESISKETIIKTVWPDTFVSDDALIRCVSELRRVFGDDARAPSVIQTIPKRGYRLMASVAARSIPSNEVSTLGYGLAAEVETLPQRRKARESLAVLPLENLSRDPEQEYLANGLTDALTTSLAKFSGLSVTSSTTAMHYKGIRKPLPEIARELGVTKLIEGSVQRFGDRVRISVKLIDASSDIHVWAECYERDLRDLLVLESEIARAVANEIRLKLTPEELNQLTSVAEFDPVAYDAYLKGSYYWSLRTLDGYEKGAEYFRQAIEKDSSFAAPEAGIAELVWRCIDGLDWLRNEPRFVNLLRVLQFAT
jgi:TolB-like protein